MDEKSSRLLKQLPKIDSLLNHPEINHLFERYPRIMVVDRIRAFVEALRQGILNSAVTEEDLEIETVTARLAEKCRRELCLHLRRAVNGAGIVLHTGMGRAPFAESAQKALADAVAHFNTLQIDLESGKRGDRYAHVENLLCKITGAEAALVVNNNAAATMLVLNTLAEGKEAIVSRGELVEIGGSFRIPDVMKRSGVKLVEVGASNRTHLKDYSQAVSENTAILLKVHQSNFRIIGFTKQTSIKELAELAKSHNLLAVDDLGSGALVDLSKWGLPKEPVVQESITAGADVVCFSGDKLIGGPQCGIIVGKMEPILRMKKNPLTRALRCGKMTFSVLESTLRLFLDEEKLLDEHPVLKMLTEPSESVKKRAQSLKRRLEAIKHPLLSIDLKADQSEAGSGALAGYTLPTWVITLNIQGMNPDSLAGAMRQADTPVIGRIKNDDFILDARTIRADEFNLIKEALYQVLARLSTLSNETA